MSNPFVRSLKANAHLEIGDAWARVALMAADMARDEWRKARHHTHLAREEFRIAARRVRRRKSNLGPDAALELDKLANAIEW